MILKMTSKVSSTCKLLFKQACVIISLILSRRSLTKSMSKNRIHLIDGDKGGVGKTFCCLVFIQYFLDKLMPFTPVEADRYNPDAARRYPKLNFEFAVFSDDDENTRADELIEYAKVNPVVISLPSQVGIPLNAWLDDSLEAAQDNEIEFVRWFISSGTFESLNLFKKSVKRHGSNMPYVFVKNQGAPDHEWSQFNPEPGLKQEVFDLIDKYNVKVIDFPALRLQERKLIDKAKITLGDVATSEVFASRSVSIVRVKKFLKQAYTTLESTRLFP